MEDEQSICQSCGMSLKTEKDFGTNENGAPNKEYCHFCFMNGMFTDEGITLIDKINNNVAIAKKMGMPEEEARKKAESVLPKLKRWNKVEQP